MINYCDELRINNMEQPQNYWSNTSSNDAVSYTHLDVYKRQMPQSTENYYEEAGRAGRDGENSQCVLLFSAQDVMIDRMLLDNKDFSDVDVYKRQIMIWISIVF